MKKAIFLLWIFLLLITSSTYTGIAQSGRNSGSTTDVATQLSVIVHNRTTEQVNLNKDNLALFDGGIEQEIEYFRYDSTGARIIILADNSQTLRTDPTIVQQIAQAIIKELKPEDRLMVIGYAEQAEIFSDFTNDVKNLTNSTTQFRKQGLPKLYDALVASVGDGFRKQIGVSKRAIVLISDGYDKDSRIKYEEALSYLLNENVVIYAFQTPDRSYGAIRPKDAGPKPVDAITSLADSTGGLLFKVDKVENIAEDAKTLMKELKENWFTLAYKPKGVNLVNTRRLLVTTPSDKLTIRTKKLHPPQL
ncbi:MAG: VWA domain-containing protein [Acidobacteria bacterium]|nr:VWA domain-containing protein [Acidobacteriota bacterium]